MKLESKKGLVMQKTIAIIPARGGSKRIPDKNIIPFCGKPMIAHSLESCSDSNLFDKIHVSTDDLRIAKVVKKLGFAIDFMRPAELADDYTPIMPVLKYVLAEYQKRGEVFDSVCMIMACAPLIKPDDLIQAQALFSQFKGKKQVLAVTQYPVPIEWAYDREDNGRLIPVQPGAFAIRSQDIGPKYYDAGVFIFMPAKSVIESEFAGDDSNFIGYVLPKNRTVDIDDPQDLLLAEALYKTMQ